MSDQEINIAIAKECGWELIENDPDYVPHFKSPDGYRMAVGLIPNYCNDLNAMHGAEQTMLFSQRKKFVRELQKVIGRQFAPEAMVGPNACIHATARQRAEAFLRTIGKWEEAAK